MPQLMRQNRCRFVSVIAVGLALLSAVWAGALPSYDPFTDATASPFGTGTSYTPNVGSTSGLLAYQTNLLGEGWGAWATSSAQNLSDSVYVSAFNFNDSSTNAQGELTNNAGLGLLPGGFPAIPDQSVLQESITSGTQGYGACLAFNRVIYPPPGEASAFGADITNTLYASFFMDVTNWGNGGTGGTYFLGFVSTAQAGNQNLSGTASEAAAVRVYLQQKTATGGGYYLEIGDGSDTGTGASAAVLCNTNQTYFVVVGYEMSGTNISGTVTNDHIRLWINPATNTFGALATPPENTNNHPLKVTLTNAAGFYLLGRNTTSGPPDGMYYGSLRIGTTWSYVTGGAEFTNEPITIANTNAGSMVTFNGAAVAAGTNVNYQWQFDGTNLSDNGHFTGSTTSNLTIANVAQADVGSYTLVASTSVDPAGFGLPSTAVTLTVDPAITAQPTISAATLAPYTNATVPLGTNVTFSISASSGNGYTPLTYRWSRNGTPLTDNGSTISGSAMATLTLSDVTASADGVYTCAVTNSQGGGQISSGATLEVVDPAISVPPQSMTANYLGTASFTVTALGTGPFRYQWLFNGAPLVNGPSISGSGATVANAQSQTLSLADVTYLDAGSYSVIVTNAVGSTNVSSAAILTVNDPSITVQPVSQTSTLAGGQTSLTVTAAGSPTLNYQWYDSAGIVHDGGDITGSSTATLNFSSLSDSDDNTYWVTVTGSQSGQTATSSNAVVTAEHPVAIITPPQNRTERAGEHTAFVVGASGTGLSYSWESNGVAIAGMTGNTFYLTNIQPASAGTYQVTVSSPYSASQSASATLTVLPGPFLNLYQSNLVVARIGDGVETLNGAIGNTLYLDQVATNGRYLNTTMILDSDSSQAGTNSFIVEGTGNGLYESVLNLSQNGQYFNIVGYNANLPNSGLSFGNVQAAAVPRSILAVNGIGVATVCLTNHALDVGGLNAFPRSVVSTDGLTNFWVAGVPASGSGIGAAAVRYLTPYSGTTFGSLGGGIDPRVVSIWNGTLYLTSGTGLGGLLDWTGIPTSGNPGVLISNMDEAVPSPNDFAISPDGLTVYIADDNTIANGGGIQRFDNGNETPTYTFGTGAASMAGAKGLAVYFPTNVTTWGAGASGAVLYATTAEPSGNRLIAIVDTNANATAVVLDTAGPNQLLRGVRFGPISVPATVVTGPEDETNFPYGFTAVFTATASGTLPLSYQWLLNGTNLSDGLSPSGSGAVISGSQTTTLTISNVTTTDGGVYTFVVSNGIPSTNAASATLSVTEVPQIEEQTSTDVEVFGGSNPTLFLGAAGPGILRYQWTSNGTVIAGATSSTYTVPNTGTGATYVGTVSSIYGTNSTSPIVLTVTPTPSAPYPMAVLADHPTDYWRLDEASGTVSYDRVGGNNGAYTNTVLDQSGYTSYFNPNSDPSETSAVFGNLATNNSFMGSVPTRVNFGTAAGGNAGFSVEAWILATISPAGAGIVSIGPGGAEQFAIDLDSAANDLRFFVRDAAGTVFSAVSDIVPEDGQWHHVVGVCDEANGFIGLYNDGVLLASNSVPPGSGLLASSQSLTVGARQEGVGTPFDDQYIGGIDDVSLFNYPLSVSQVQAHYVAAGIAPTDLQVQPATENTNVGETAVFMATALGTGPLSYYWTDGDGHLLSTNAVLTVPDVQPGGYNYQVVVSNAYGQASGSGNLAVFSGAASILTDVFPLVTEAPPGYPISFVVGVVGTPPFSYQWYLNATTPIPGATNSTYNFLASPGTNTYTLWVTNESGTSVASSSAATVMVGATPPVIGFGDGTGWTLNGGATISGSPATLELTDGNTSEARSAFYNIPQYIAGFLASFTYTPSGGTATRADGTTFTLQTASIGASSLGGDGNQLGYGGITPSVAFELDIYTGDAGGTGISLGENGSTAGTGGSPNGGTGPVNINSGDPIAVTLYYSYGTGQLGVKLVDGSAGATYVTNYNVGNLATLLGGDFAYVGFTGATGGSDSVQQVSNFSFSYSETPVMSASHGAGGTLVISWPATVSTSFVLQQGDSLAGPWSDAGTSPSINGQYQVTISPQAVARFYRLIAQ
ncbi:MAG TPA: immunoglobulin domain-containing protein [Verrucomicrobiae bacterium]|nr:immunoglobulin domain-containing protein [Verrucomicrobiae bacterium]